MRRRLTNDFNTTNNTNENTSHIPNIQHNLEDIVNNHENILRAANEVNNHQSYKGTQKFTHISSSLSKDQTDLKIKDVVKNILESFRVEIESSSEVKYYIFN